MCLINIIFALFNETLLMFFFFVMIECIFVMFCSTDRIQLDIQRDGRVFSIHVTPNMSFSRIQ